MKMIKKNSKQEKEESILKKVFYNPNKAVTFSIQMNLLEIFFHKQNQFVTIMKKK